MENEDFIYFGIYKRTLHKIINIVLLVLLIFSILFMIIYPTYVIGKMSGWNELFDKISSKDEFILKYGKCNSGCSAQEYKKGKGLFELTMKEVEGGISKK